MNTYLLRPGEQYQAVRNGLWYIITIQNVSVLASLDGQNVTVKYDVTRKEWLGKKIVQYGTPWQVVTLLVRWGAVVYQSKSEVE